MSPARFLAVFLGIVGLVRPAMAGPEPEFPEPPAVPAEFLNPWPEAWESAFRERGLHALAAHATGRLPLDTRGENERDGEARAMFAFLAGRRAEALRILQAGDAQADTDHRHTFGIDLYFAPVLGLQVRKAFYFGRWLEPDYTERLVRGTRVWTAEDPLGRPHPLHGRGDPRRAGWGPEARGGWADARDTDGLRVTRDAAIYLFAEATGNERTRQVARGRLAAVVRMYYHTGPREWDSSAWLPQGLAGWHNLYDFARDPEVRLLGKAALDWLYAAAALKSWRGGIGGPQLRDSGGSTVPFASGASHPVALMFGDAPMPDPAPDLDDLFLVTSAYRAPQAVVELARKRVERPVELLSARAPYELWQTNRTLAPRYWETLFLGRTFQMGSVTSPDAETNWNPSVFSFMAYDTRRGVSHLGLNTTPSWEPPVKREGDQVAQYRQLLVWIRPASPEVPFHLQVPRSIEPIEEGGVWFLTFERTWVAVRTFGLGPWKETPCTAPRPGPYAGERFYQAGATGTNYVGVALEVGEASSYSAFQRDVVGRGRLDLDGLAQGRVELVGSDGRRLSVQHNDRSEVPRVERDGRRHDWSRHVAVFGPVGGRAPIHQAWLGGTLRVEAGGEIFEQTVTRDGRVVR